MPRCPTYASLEANIKTIGPIRPVTYRAAVDLKRAVKKAARAGKNLASGYLALLEQRLGYVEKREDGYRKVFRINFGREV